MHISEGGQLPIPRNIIKKLGFTKATPLEYQIRDDALIVRKKRKKMIRIQLREALERMIGSATVKLTTEEIMQMTRGED